MADCHWHGDFWQPNCDSCRLVKERNKAAQERDRLLARLVRWYNAWLAGVEPAEDLRREVEELLLADDDPLAGITRDSDPRYAEG